MKGKEIAKAFLIAGGLGIAGGGCSSAPAPTPEKIYVTPAPTVTPEIIYVTPAPGCDNGCAVETPAPMLKDILGEPNVPYTTTGWYLVDGDVFVQAPGCQLADRTFDDGRLTGQATVVPPGTRIEGQWGFDAHPLAPAGEVPLNVNSDNILSYIQSDSQQRMQATLHDSRGNYHLTSIRVSLLNPDGTLSVLETVTPTPQGN